MSITLINAVESAITTNSTSVTLTAPSGVVVGDVLVAFWVSGSPTTGGVVTAAPTGWVQIAEPSNGIVVDGYYKVATAADASAGSYTWTISVACDWAGGIACYRGVDGTTPMDVTPATASSGSPLTLPSVTTTKDGAVVLAGVAEDESSSTYTAPLPSGWATAIPLPAAGRVGLMASIAKATAGAVGTTSWPWTASYSGQGMAGWIAALRPSAATTVNADYSTTATAAGAATMHVPTGLTVTPASQTELDVSWDPSVGATAYDLERDGATIQTAMPGTSYADTGLTAGSSHTYRVRSVFQPPVWDPADSSRPYGDAAAVGAWAPAFSDEFSGSSLDTTRWVALVGNTTNNVTTSAANVSVSGGNLVLTLASSTSGAEVSSSPGDGAGVNGYDFAVGDYVEARVFYPGDGTIIYNWPAWWTSGPQWPTAGEIDIAEVLGKQLTSNYHYGPLSVDNQLGPWQAAGYWGNAWHVYGCHRQAGQVDIYWDGKIIRTFTPQDNGGGQSVLMNVGYDGSSTNVFGASGAMLVDWVRAWTPA